MELAEVFEKENQQITKEDLIPYDKVEDEEVKKNMAEIASYLSRSISDIYYYKETLFPNIFYYKDIFITEIPHNLDFIKELGYEKSFNKAEDEVKRARREGNYSHVLMLGVHSKARLWMFNELYEEMPKEERLQIFKEIYREAEYGFQQFDKNMIAELIESDIEGKERLNRLFGEEKYLTVYRGMGTKSTPLDKAYSWTLDFNTALMFAAKHSKEGKVYKGKIFIEKPVLYIGGREDEIIVLPEDVKDIEPMDLMNLSEADDEIGWNRYEYEKFRSLINTEHYHNPGGIHGIGHVKRVLYLAYVLSNLEELDDYQRKVVAYAAVYHDIGRNNDSLDFKHGLYSYKKAKNLGIINKMEEDELFGYYQKAVKFIIENHQIDDEDGLKNLHSYKFRDEDREEVIILYKIFKDCDGLDRVRLRDLDPRYLRTESAKKMVLAAEKLFQIIKD